ncbi:MAG: 4'-phosphopantetheinyl transferase superfamily protein [Clostridia bacterium]|nr:4'-phosphopantetheinyl transferase superfamily protein [Clostridia bacterium]
MLYLALVDISDVTEESCSFLREELVVHFTEKASLKRKDSICAKALLCNILEEKFNLDGYLIDCDENEKPYLCNSNLHFNLSHSGNFVLCVCGEEKVGCDIQLLKECNEKIAKRFFSNSEFQLLSKSENKDSDFTRIWTLKESILKYYGVGISGGLDSYDFSGYIKENHFVAYGLNFTVRQTDEYVVSVCSETDEIELYSINEEIIKKRN